MTFASHFLSYFILVLLSSLRTGPTLYAQVGSPSPPPSFCSQALDSGLEEAYSQLVIELFQEGILSTEQVQALADEPVEFIEIIGSANVKTSAAIGFFKEIQAAEPEWDKISDILNSFIENTNEGNVRQQENVRSSHPIVNIMEVFHETKVQVEKRGSIHKINWKGRPALIGTAKKNHGQIERDSMVIFDPVKGKVLKQIQIPAFDSLNDIFDVVETDNGNLVLASYSNSRTVTKDFDTYLVLFRLESEEVVLAKPLPCPSNIFRFHASQGRLIAYGLTRTKKQITVVQIREEEKEWEFQTIDLNGVIPHLPNLETLKNVTFEYDNEVYLCFFSHANSRTPQTFHLVNLSQIKLVSSTPMKYVEPSPLYITALDTGRIIIFSSRQRGGYLYAFDPFNPQWLQLTDYPSGHYKSRPPTEILVNGKRFLSWITIKGLKLLTLDESHWSSVFGSPNPDRYISTEFPLYFRDTPPFSVWSFEQAGDPFLLIQTIYSLTQVIPEPSKELDDCVEETLDVDGALIYRGFRFDSQGSSYLVTVQDDNSIKTFHIAGLPLQ